MNICCVLWKTQVESIKVVPHNEKDISAAATLEQLIKYQVGQFCPTCGGKL